MKNLLEFVPRASLVVRNLILFGIILAFFFFGANFALRQACGLSISLYIILWIVDRDYCTEADFCPMGIHVMPKWGLIFKKYGLVQNEEEWGKLRETIGKLPADRYNILRDGIWFYSLTPKLMYLSKSNEFKTCFRFNSITRIPEVETWFTVRLDGLVYRIEIQTPESVLERPAPGHDTTLGIFWIRPVGRHNLTLLARIEHLDISKIAFESEPDQFLHRELVMQEGWKRSKGRDLQLDLEYFSVTRWEL